jgi:glycosyltransferase involved in cell wall biosynthesis
LRRDINIAVVVPVYNKESYIEECVQSILDQILPPTQIIFVDDGSTDKGLQIVEKMKDSRFTIIHQENAGVSAARNAGIKSCKYEYIAFLDADDIWLPEHTLSLSALVEKYPEKDIWSTGFIKKRGNVELIRSCVSSNCDLSLRRYLENILEGNNLVWTSATMARTSKIKELGGFMVGYNHGEDIALWLSIILNGDGVAVSGEPSAIYRQHGGGLTNCLVSKPDACMVTVDRIIGKNNLEEDIQQKLIELKCRYALAHAIGALRHGKRIVAKRFVCEAKKTKRYLVKYLVLKFFVSIKGGSLLYRCLTTKYIESK